WADWLYGEHPPAHRHAVLEKFASDTITNQNQGASEMCHRPHRREILRRNMPSAGQGKHEGNGAWPHGSHY
ncbi:hypothetical protein, partial [Streptomyces sp. NPDC001933]|uniref:hypothetical protein n=1 Tax=Streptomyces sp. NPDC001933 TaxID=3364626 RepID=UPI0036D186BC